MEPGIPKVSDLRTFGYWWSAQEPDLPRPSQYVDRAWKKLERAQVVAYLQQSHRYRHWRGYSWCRFGCGIPAKTLGAYDLTDGAWLFPEGLAHYVERHEVKPPDDFLQRIRGNDYMVPDIPELKGELGALFVEFGVDPSSKRFQELKWELEARRPGRSRWIW